MSEKITCGTCGMLLYFGEEIRRRLYMCAIPSEAQVLSAYGNICPRCKSELAEETVKVEIKRRARHGS